MKNNPSSNNFQQANYALMMYDKKRDAFRMVPIQRHLFFEKQKNIEKKKEVPTNNASKARPPGQTATGSKSQNPQGQPGAGRGRGGGKMAFHKNIKAWNSVFKSIKGAGALKTQEEKKPRRKGKDEDSELGDMDAPEIDNLDDNEEYHQHMNANDEDENVELKALS